VLQKIKKLFDPAIRISSFPRSPLLKRIPTHYF
jgi:hypothetical protein